MKFIIKQFILFYFNLKNINSNFTFTIIIIFYIQSHLKYTTLSSSYALHFFNIYFKFKILNCIIFTQKKTLVILLKYKKIFTGI